MTKNVSQHLKISHFQSYQQLLQPKSRFSYILHCCLIYQNVALSFLYKTHYLPLKTLQPFVSYSRSPTLNYSI